MLGNARVAAMLPVTDLGRSRKFYEGSLGLRVYREEPDGGLLFECGGGSLFGIYERPPVKVEHTQAGFEVQDLESEMRSLRSKGITFENYDMPNLRTENGIATIGGTRGAWFKDPDGNILALTQSTRTGGLSTNR
ncbi:MAG: VOC family protein [Chloroflexota bacterium]